MGLIKIEKLLYVWPLTGNNLLCKIAFEYESPKMQ